MLKAKFDFIRYANCWEDADMLLSALQLPAGCRILSVASAGDNSLAMLSAAPERLTVVDVNPVQLFLTELKALCIKKLTYEEFFKFLTTNSNKNLKIYKLLRNELTVNARIYWDQQTVSIENGIIYAGKFEKYLLSFGKIILPLIHSKKITRRLFEPKSALQQKIFYNHTWNNYRWKWLFRIFFNRYVLGAFGRDPEFLEQVDLKVSSFLNDRSALHLSSKEVQSNYFLAYMLLGSFTYGLPFYLREENFFKIKFNIDALEMKEGYAEVALKLNGNYSHFNFSNIFEYMPLKTFKEFGNMLVAHTRPQSQFAYWNLMVTRKLSDLFPQNFVKQTPPALIDKGFFYKEFITETKI
ncbi:MAG: DUF3419 family protein [Bacteroidia bacterium]|nr:DUF3419 family protein [Bacteroidia bacterium]